MPDVFPEPGVKTALLPAGRPERSAVSDAIGSPSASAACTAIESAPASSTDAVAGAVTAGARSRLATAITVLPAPESALAAVNVTV